MIQTKEDLRLYLEKDKQALGITRKRPCLVGDGECMIGVTTM